MSLQHCDTEGKFGTSLNLADVLQFDPGLIKMEPECSIISDPANIRKRAAVSLSPPVSQQRPRVAERRRVDAAHRSGDGEKSRRLNPRNTTGGVRGQSKLVMIRDAVAEKRSQNEKLEAGLSEVKSAVLEVTPALALLEKRMTQRLTAAVEGVMTHISTVGLLVEKMAKDVAHLAAQLDSTEVLQDNYASDEYDSEYDSSLSVQEMDGVTSNDGTANHNELHQPASTIPNILQEQRIDTEPTSYQPLQDTGVLSIEEDANYYDESGEGYQSINDHFEHHSKRGKRNINMSLAELYPKPSLAGHDSGASLDNDSKHSPDMGVDKMLQDLHGVESFDPAAVFLPIPAGWGQFVDVDGGPSVRRITWNADSLQKVHLLAKYGPEDFAFLLGCDARSYVRLLTPDAFQSAGKGCRLIVQQMLGTLPASTNFTRRVAPPRHRVALAIRTLTLNAICRYSGLSLSGAGRVIRGLRLSKLRENGVLGQPKPSGHSSSQYRPPAEVKFEPRLYHSEGASEHGLSSVGDVSNISNSLFTRRPLNSSSSIT